MNSLHILYIETMLDIKIGEFVSGVAEFTGHLPLDVIQRKVNNTDCVFFQNPDAPVSNLVYLYVPVGVNERFEFAVDFNYNYIYTTV